MLEMNDITRRRFVASAASAAVLGGSPVVSKGDSPKEDVKAAERMTLTPYLLFNGNCREAMDFYKACLGGELEILKVKDSPAKDHMPAFQQDKVLNARLHSGLMEVSASDWLRPDETPVRGNTVCMYLSGGSFEGLKDLFERLSDGGDVTDPLRSQFFGVYGALNDRFGVRWMFVSAK